MRRLAMLVVCLGLGLAACGRDDAENAGEAMEDAATAAGKAARSAAEEAGKAADAAAEAAADAADAAMDTADDAAEAASDAAGDAADAASDAADAAGDAAEAAADAVTSGGSQGCLDLVAEARFAEAVPVCTGALADDPTNQAVKDALDKAKAATGQ